MTGAFGADEDQMSIGREHLGGLLTEIRHALHVDSADATCDSGNERIGKQLRSGALRDAPGKFESALIERWSVHQQRATLAGPQRRCRRIDRLGSRRCPLRRCNRFRRT